MNIDSALQKLFSLHQFGIKLGLDNTLKLLDHIGNPHPKLKAFHIAGSNGKGSTASFLASILMEAGYKVGLYTSPHFVKYNERIRINSVMIDDDYVARFVSDLEEYIKNNEPTFFELTTALAFKYFEEKKIDFAVIETGLGGRLDSTNVINPLASIITSISLEHTNILGDTIEKIAFEKAGIIKENSNLFVGLLPNIALNVINKKAEQVSCNVFDIRKFILEEKERLIIKLKEKTYSIYSTPLRGIHQFYNVALAVKAANQILGLNNGVIISKGIKNVIVNSGIQCRYEIVNESPKIIFDSAHNPEGVQTFANEFSKEYKSYSERILIFGAMNDKAIGEMLIILQPFFSKIYLTQINTERAALIQDLQKVALDNKINAIPLPTADEFIIDFYNRSTNDCLIVLGSMYLLGEIKSKMLDKRLDKKKNGD